MFVKELVNNLNKDNETLNANIDDLKNAFIFLYEKHKVLKQNYAKECMNRSVIENWKKDILSAVLVWRIQKLHFHNS